MEFLKKQRMMAYCLTLSLLIHLFFLLPSLPKEKGAFSYIPLETIFLKKEVKGNPHVSPPSNLKASKSKAQSLNQVANQPESSGGPGGETRGELTEAQALQSLEPQYPEISRRKGEEGICVVSVKISSSGKVEGLVLEKSSGFKRLDESALKQVRETKFLPAKKGDLSLPSEKKIVFRFSLKNSR